MSKNRKKRKVIHIYNRSYNSYFPSNNSPHYFMAGWSSQVAKKTLKYSKKYEIENWRPERDVKKNCYRFVNDIFCRLFPAKKIFLIGYVSFKLIKELKKEVKKNNILIHLHGVHNIFPTLITALLFKKTPIIAQHHGGSPALSIFKRKKRMCYLLMHLIEIKALKNVDYFFVLNKYEKDFLSHYFPEKNIIIQGMGIDFCDFDPNLKKQAREKLNIPDDKKVLLHIGKFYKAKGLNIILEAFNKLKNKYNLELILIGGSSNDILYKDVVSSGATFYEFLPHNELKWFLYASDFYLLPTFLSSYQGGIGMAVVEAMACNIPVLSTTLSDFPTEEWREVGEIPKDETDVVNCIIRLLENPNKYSKAREISKMHYDWSIIAKKTIEVYNKLFKIYYESEN